MFLTVHYLWKCGHKTFAYTEEYPYPEKDNCIPTTKTFDKSQEGLAVKAKDCMPCRSRYALDRKEQRKALAKMSEEELRERKKAYHKAWYDKKRGRERLESKRKLEDVKEGVGTEDV